MPLHFDLKVNQLGIGRMWIGRVSNTGTVKLDPDEVSTYLVKVNDVRMGLVEHRYGDGPWKLTAKAIEMAAPKIAARWPRPDLPGASRQVRP